MDVPMVLVECCDCHIPFAMSEEYNKALMNCHNMFYCPKGHAQSYRGKSELELARESRDAAIRLKLAAQEELEQLKKEKRKKKSVNSGSIFNFQKEKL